MSLGTIPIIILIIFLLGCLVDLADASVATATALGTGALV
jgi:hypothetical protein